MRKFTLFVAFIFMIGMQILQAQDREISGVVTSSEDSQPIPGVQVLIKGTQLGVVTDLDGKYSLKVPATATTLIFKFVGMTTQEITIGTSKTINVVMNPDVLNIEGVVVTALGISREKKSLGYATQELGGEEINQVKTDNFISQLSGKVAGVQVKTNGNMGGSTNILIRGSSSITGNNQALIVVDGVPIGNANTNTRDQIRGRAGYDFGNAASDINPNDVETISVLKGAAATALYGSRAANGVIMVTTKKGSKMVGKRKVYGVNISSNVTTGFIDKSTFPKYQTEYGGGYGAQFYSETDYPGFEYLYDINGDGTTDYSVPTYEDASYGQKFDESFLVYQWDSFYPESPNYKKATPWKAADNGPLYFFQTPWSFTNSVDVTGGGEQTAFRLGYTNMDETGIMPNSSLKRNNFLFNGSYDITKRIRISASANYVNTKAKGRNSTGYSDNIMSSFRQWMQMNVDYKQQQEMYDQYEHNVTWNPVSPDDLAPAYWDNPYWVRFQNYESDQRNRIIAYLQADYDLTDYLAVMARYSVDTYDELQEERKAYQSAPGEFGVPTTAGRDDVTSGYSKLNYGFMERNIDVMARFHKDLTEDFNLAVMLGTNIRRTRIDQVFASTSGGLINPGLYAVTNSVNPYRVEEDLQEIGVNGFYGSASLGYKRFLYLDGTYRQDVSSTLPNGNWSYEYPGVSLGFVFSELAKANWLDHGKFRVSYAKVGNDAPWGSLLNSYDPNPLFNGTALYSVSNQNNDPTIKPEISSSIETGLEMYFLKKRLGFDVAWYKSNTVNQIFPVAVSFATGYSTKIMNAGEVENKGIELTLYGAPVKKQNFIWDITLNWARNINEVVSLADSIANIQLAALQGGVTINARIGEPYGTIQGTDFIYDDNGQRVVGANGYYMRTPTSDVVLGDINPDWTAGIMNRFSYKNWMLSFLIDWQQGGSLFSLDLYYGMGTGLYEETVYTNDLGNPVRNSIEDGGGIVLDGVTGDVTFNEDGTYTVTNTAVNTTRVPGDDYRALGWARNPNSKFVYDATYIKLREVVLTYTLPNNLFEKSSFINGASLSLVGSNLWIISKDLPHADPETGHTSGNVQGWQSGVMPTTRNIGFTVNLQF